MVPGTAVGQSLHVATLALLAVSTFGTARPSAGAEDDPCPAYDDEYNVVETVWVQDTLLGAANGVYPLGSGTMRLRFQQEVGEQAVKLMSYEISSRLTVRARVPIFSTTVVTESRASAGVNSCEGSADGTLRDGRLTWNTPIAGYHSEGTIDCSGLMCGRFGAPPRGRSPIPDTSASQRFGTFTFSADGATFTMPYVLVSRSTTPRQSTYMAMSGRRVTRLCTTEPTTACAHLVGPRG
jgi:hypothetical protein